METDLEEPEIMRSAEIEMEQSIAVNDEDDNIYGAENEIARKMESFTAPKQFLKEPMRSGEDDNMSTFKQPSKINETGEPDVVEPVVVEITETAAVETEEENKAEKSKEIEPVATEGMSLEQFTDSEDTEPLSKVLALTVKSTSDEESIPIDDLLAMIPVDMMLPSLTAEEPTKIRVGLGIAIPGVNDGDWYKASLTKIDVTNKGKAPLVVKDEIKAIVPVGPVVERTGILKRSVNNVQYNIQIVDSLSLPYTDSVTADPVVDTVTDSIVALDTSQRSPDAYLVSPSSYSDSQMRFTTDDIPLGDEPTDVLPPDRTSEFAQLRASVDQIYLEHVQTKIQIARLKVEFFAKISILETLFLSRAENQDRAARVQTEIFRKEVKDQKAALAKEFEDQLAVIRNDLLEFRVETQEQYTTLRDNLAELISFFNRGMTKRGKWVAANDKVRNLHLMIGADLVEAEVVEVSLQRREIVVRKVE
ncbi:splicing factor 3B subunit 1-like [Dorcoceras hygrometricum]|uniref:Splicing factor 3B subunit 1-like n=1 Tax=Dorcoceras hygrometricum TaxID=472368 RepID=A0A2Z7AJH4_9LAMI|nr:splicing factor 3B subunit 1-like [Dorcoceras hygrometricum]